MQTFEFADDGFDVGRFCQAEATAREIQPGDAETLFVGEHRGDEVVAMFGEQGFVRQRAWRDNARDLSLDRSFARRRVADLLANGDRLPFAHEFCKIALGRVIGNAGHRNRVAARLAA